MPATKDPHASVSSNASSEPTAVDLQGDDWVVLTRETDVATAGVVRAQLTSQGITCRIPDEHTAGVAWHLSGAIGGVAVWVRPDKLDVARELLETSSTLDDDELPEELRDDPAERDGEAASAEEQEALARRATKVAVVSTLFCPLLPYAAYLCAQAGAAPSLAPKVRRNLNWATLIVLGQLGLYAVVGYLMLTGNP